MAATSLLFDIDRLGIVVIYQPQRVADIVLYHGLVAIHAQLDIMHVQSDGTAPIPDRQLRNALYASKQFSSPPFYANISSYFGLSLSYSTIA